MTTLMAGSGVAAGDAGALRDPATLTRRQKAAIVVRLLLNEGADVPVAQLPDDMQAALTQAMGAMRYVSREALASVVREFADELDSIGLAFPRGLAGALSVMDGRISARTAQRLRKEAGVRESGDPWLRIRTLPVEDLRPVAETEAVEVAAVMVSMLDTEKAADLMAALPGERARRIAYAISLTGQVTPDAVDRIGLSIASQLDRKPDRAFEETPDERVGAILNYSPSPTRDDVLEGLDEADRDFAEAVRKAIFTFAHIPERVEARDVPRVLRTVEPGELTLAMAAAQQAGMEETVEYVLENMSKRMADALREQIAEAGKVRQRDGEAAMAKLVAGIRELEASGEITLRTGDEEP